jgi:hypothetical protein
MIVYRAQRTRARTTDLLSQLHSALHRFGPGSLPTHDDTVGLLIRAGTLESAICDVIFAEVDNTSPLSRRLRELSVATGHMVWHTWTVETRGVERWWTQAAVTLAHLEMQRLPDWVETTVPEGFAQYAVYPEMYLEAARRCQAELGRFDGVCLGLRSVGTSLSAAVTAALRELGCRIKTYTLRPRGHPYDRRPVLGPELHQALGVEKDAYFLLVDEGPGISGSSLAGTADELQRMGVADERIIFLPSWTTDGSALRSEVARQHWPRHRQYTATFEEVWLEAGRLGAAFCGGRVQDLSGGSWRPEILRRPEKFPPVQPQHERRKYLVHSEAGTEPGSATLFKFVGLGQYGEPKLRRAERLAEARFTCEPCGVLNGFIALPFVPGTPVSPGETDSQLLETLATYLAHLSQQHAAEPSVSVESLEKMATVNTSEGLGEAWIPRLEGWLRSSSKSWCEKPVALDGRMLPHEWIRTASGYLKTDAIDHYDDHFYPGCQDIAWDIAAACIEHRLTHEQQSHLLDRYRSMSGDRTIAARLPIHAIGYLAFRLGYTTMAAEALGDEADGRRFAASREHYSSLLRHELSRPPR